MSKTHVNELNAYYNKLFVKNIGTYTRIVEGLHSNGLTAIQHDESEPSSLQKIAFFPYYQANTIAFNFFNRFNWEDDDSLIESAQKNTNKILVVFTIIPILPALTLVAMALTLAIALIASVIYPFACLGAALQSDKSNDKTNDVVFPQHQN